MSIGTTSWLSFDFAHDLIFVQALGYVNALPRVFGTGPLAASSTFRSTTVPIAVDGEGSEIYGLMTSASGDAQLVVFPATATGMPTPTRILQGTATRLNLPKGLAICN
jgi:hypothetical protein